MRLTKLIILITLLASIVTGFATAGLISGYSLAHVTGAQPIDARSEYYRGVYDVCMQQMRRADFCIEVVRRVVRDEWFEKPSSGWGWPVLIEGRQNG